MPFYTYRCSCGRVFDKRASVNQDAITCTCGATARRASFYSEQTVIMEHAAIPSSEEGYTLEADKRKLSKRGWDGDRAMEHIRHNVGEDAEGHKVLLPSVNDVND